MKWINFKYRNYDDARGRFMTVKRLSEKFLFQSHYPFRDNRVIMGLESEEFESYLINKGYRQ